MDNSTRRGEIQNILGEASVFYTNIEFPILLMSGKYQASNTCQETMQTELSGGKLHR